MEKEKKRRRKRRNIFSFVEEKDKERIIWRREILFCRGEEVRRRKWRKISWGRKNCCGVGGWVYGRKSKALIRGE